MFSNQAIFYEVISIWNIDPVPNTSLTKKYNAAIVLGGMVSLDSKKKQIEFFDNADRIFGVLPLYFQGKVDKILISGGSGRVFDPRPESTILQNYLIQIGVKKEDILIEDKSRNTYENAKFSAKKIRELQIEPPYLLSTSAMHMRRALMCFEAQNMEVQAFSQDQLIYKRELTFDVLFLPNAKILQYWYQLFHEWLGVLSYKISGYI